MCTIAQHLCLLLFPSYSLCRRQKWLPLLYVRFFCRCSSIPNLAESVAPLSRGLHFNQVMGKSVFVNVFSVFLFSLPLSFFFFKFFYFFKPGTGRKESRNLVMPVVYLVAYLLKDLTLELSTQPASGKSLTHNINLSLWLQTAPSFLSRAF